jgi:hypothetical protein
MTHDGGLLCLVADAPLPWIETDASLGNGFEFGRIAAQSKFLVFRFRQRCAQGWQLSSHFLFTDSSIALTSRLGIILGTLDSKGVSASCSFSP